MLAKPYHSLGLKAQLAVATGLGLTESAINLHCYHGEVDLSALDIIDRHYQHQEPLPDYSDDGFMAFIFSKPSIADNKVSIHVYQPNDLEPQLWIKMKSPEALAEVFGGQPQPLDVQTLQQTLLLPAEKKTLCVDAQLLSGGPDWIRTPITIGISADANTLCLPVVQTPLDVNPRFAGHCYIKFLVLSP